MATSVDHQIYFDLANETVRRYGEIQQDFPQKMAKRLKRRFHADLNVATILALANHFKEIYQFGASVFKDFITPTKGKYASSGDIKLDYFIAVLIGRYPEENKAILKTISDWVIYYEYLR